MGRALRGLLLHTGGHQPWLGGQPRRCERRPPSPPLRKALGLIATFQADFAILSMSSLMPHRAGVKVAIDGEQQQQLWWDVVPFNALGDIPGVPAAATNEMGDGADADAADFLSLLVSAPSWSSAVCGVVTAARWSAEEMPQIEAEMARASFLGLAAIVVPPIPVIGTDSDQQVNNNDVRIQEIVACVRRHCRQGHTKVFVAAPIPCWAPHEMSSCEREAFTDEIAGRNAWRGFAALRRGCAGDLCDEIGSLAPNPTIGKLLPLPVLIPQLSSACCKERGQFGHFVFDPVDAGPFMGESPLGFILASLGGCAAASQWWAAIPRESSPPGNSQKIGGCVGTLGQLSHCCTSTPTSLYATSAGCLAHFQPVSVLIGEFLRRRCNPVLGIAGDALPALAEPYERLDALHFFVDNAAAALANEYQQLNAATEEFSAYEDELQMPLQPLGHHLSSATYSVFEHDAAKYEHYRAAIAQHLVRFFGSAPTLSAATSSAAVEVVVLGAGRGPLITKALEALLEQMRLIPRCISAFTIIAIEKNPGAAEHLRLMVDHCPTWRSILASIFEHEPHLRSSSRIHVVEGDGRDRASDVLSILRQNSSMSPTPCRLLVSELLGSFGDNELSSECIEGFMSSLQQEAHKSSAPAEGRGGASSAPCCWDSFVSIPASYCAHISPVHSSRLHDAVRNAGKELSEWDNAGSLLVGTPSPSTWARTAFHGMLVTLGKKWHLLAEPQRILPVSHRDLVAAHGATPASVSSSCIAQDNATFVINGPCELSGFAGYFSATLTPPSPHGPSSKAVDEGDREIVISTHPAHHTPGMYSWFPVFLPIERPVTLDGGEEVRILVRRCCSTSAVWYEWDAFVNEVCVSRMNVGGSNGRHQILLSSTS